MGLKTKIRKMLAQKMLGKRAFRNDLEFKNIVARQIISNILSCSMHDLLAFGKYARIFKFIRDDEIQSKQNLSRYLELVRPHTAPSMQLARIGGDGDGGYLMLPPPPHL